VKRVLWSKIRENSGVFTKLNNDKFYILNKSVLIILFSFYFAFIPYCAVNLLRRGYKNQSVNAL
jgi:hypothetical protein